MTTSEKERWKELWNNLIQDGWNIFLGIAAICSVVGIFWKVPNNQILWVMAVIILWLLITLFRVVRKLVRNEIKDDDLDIPCEIQKMVKYLYEKKKYNDVVRLGSTISRFLWLNHYYKQRIAIGDMVEDALDARGIGADEFVIFTKPLKYMSLKEFIDKVSPSKAEEQE